MITDKKRKPAPKPASQVQSPKFPLPYTTVDVVIFTVLKDKLQVLLVQRGGDATNPFPGSWALPGGFVNVDQDIDLIACARRKLLEKTGVVSPYLEQLGSWGSPYRDPRGWSATHVYFALIPGTHLELIQGANAADVGWVPINNALKGPPLAFDHSHILEVAAERLCNKVEYTSLPAFLLEDPFTLPQLQHIYEVVLGRPVDKSGFRTRMLAADFLIESGLVKGGSHRPAMSYRLRHRDKVVVFPRTFSPRG